MSGQHAHAVEREEPPSAHDRFKGFYRGRLGVAVLVSVAAHYLGFEYFPQLTPSDLGVAGDEIAVVDLPPQVEIPPPPEQIARPATPRVSAEPLSEEVTIAPTTFEDNPAESLAPPPSQQVDPRGTPVYIARDVEPWLKNPNHIRGILERLYPRALRDAGVGGVVVLWVFVEPDGSPGDIRVQKSSGYTSLDEAAERVAEEMEFSPAMLRDVPVGVWIAQSIRFAVEG